MSIMSLIPLTSLLGIKSKDTVKTPVPEIQEDNFDRVLNKVDEIIEEELVQARLESAIEEVNAAIIACHKHGMRLSARNASPYHLVMCKNHKAIR